MQRKNLSPLPRLSTGQHGLRASLLWGVGPPLVQKCRLHLNREAFSPGARPHLPGDWRTPLCRVPAARIGAVSPQFQPPLLGHPTLLPPLWLPDMGSRRDNNGSRAFPALRDGRGFQWYLSFPRDTESVETTEMREELGPLCGHIERATLSHCGPRRCREIGATGRHHRETGCALS